MKKFLILAAIIFLVFLLLTSAMRSFKEGMETATNETTPDTNTDDDVFIDETNNSPSSDDATNKDDDEIKPYNTDNPSNALILAQQNAGNILSLQDQIKTLKGMDRRLANLEQTVENQQDEINGLVEQQAQYAQDISAKDPVEISGM